MLSSNVTDRQLWLQRVENGLAAGMPDVVALFAGRVTWLELKVNEEPPARPSTPVLGKEHGCNNEQINWHLDWARCDGHSRILIGVGRGRARQLFYVPGALARDVNAMTMTQLASFRTDWSALRHHLKV